VIGEQYLPIAFRMAAAADPTAKLYYNDYNLEYGEAKHKGALRIVKLVQSWGVKIDGVGLQGHLTSESTGTQSVATPSVAILTKTLQDYADLGVDVAYTELDIRSNTPSNSNKESVAAAAWARVAQSCINVSRCVGITIWVSNWPSIFLQMQKLTVHAGRQGRLQLGSWNLQWGGICATLERQLPEEACLHCFYQCVEREKCDSSIRQDLYRMERK
jgi:hypothetical protein